jgi:microcystin-dependent protein
VTEPFLGQIFMFGFNFAPVGHAFCRGQLLPISQNTALFALLGTTYGGNGQTTFALPNLQGRAPVGVGQGAGLSAYGLGQETGTETVTVSAAQMPSHSHAFDANNMKGTLRCRDERANQRGPAGNVLARESSGVTAPFAGGTLQAAMAPAAVGLTGAPALVAAGGNQPHNNMQPYLVLNYCIALAGVFPAQP